MRYRFTYTETIVKRCEVDAPNEDEARSLFWAEVETYDAEIVAVQEVA